ncbi:MAG: hypothetical protein ACI8T1_001061 [Verrucomicrobiales bacterium]|jgi:hypothetical protein
MALSHRLSNLCRLGMACAIAMLGIGCGSSSEDEIVPSSMPPSSGEQSEISQWDSEAYQDLTAEQLDRIEVALLDPSLQDLSTVLDSEFSGTSLRPPVDQAQLVYDQNGTRVLHWNIREGDLVSLPGRHEMLKALDELRSSWPVDAVNPRVKLKQFRIEPHDGEIVSQVSYRAYAQGAETGVQQTATWACGWEQISGDRGATLPRMRWLRLEHLEEVQVEMIRGEALLVDVTDALIGSLPCFQQQLRYGANHWITRLPNLNHRFHHGVAIGDVDGDGQEDFYVCQPEGLPNLLLLRMPDGRLRVCWVSGASWLFMPTNHTHGIKSTSYNFSKRLPSGVHRFHSHPYLYTYIHA